MTNSHQDEALRQLIATSPLSPLSGNVPPDYSNMQVPKAEPEAEQDAKAPLSEADYALLLAEWQLAGDAPAWLDAEGVRTLLKGYLGKGETPAGMYRRLAYRAESLLPSELRGIGDALYEAFFAGWLSPASPVAANFGEDAYYPVSCFGFMPGNSIDNIFAKAHEAAMLSKNGGGLGNSLDLLDGVSPATQWAKLYDTTASIVNQNGVRRGSIAQGMDIEHKDFDALLHAKDVTQGDHREKLDCNLSAHISDAFMQRVLNNEPEAKQKFANVLMSGLKFGSPYLFFRDNANRLLPEWYKKIKLSVKHSQLCNEIMLHSDVEHTYTCVLSSQVLSRWKEWCNKRWRIGEYEFSLTMLGICFLDAVNEEFIRKAKGKPGMECAVRFAEKSRALGLGVLGLASYYQSQGWPFASPEARAYCHEVFSNMRTEAEKATKLLAELAGEPEWCKGFGRRNTHLLAIAPTLTNSVLCAAGSAGVEPVLSNAYVFEGAKASTYRKNKHLVDLLTELGHNTEQVWDSIVEHDGSVQHLDCLSEEQKAVFLTALEIDQYEIVLQTGIIQPYIDQGISRNLYIRHDAPAKDVWGLHIRMWQAGCKGRYYIRSTSPLTKATTLAEYKPASQAFVHIASRDTCKYCIMAKALLDKHGISYTESNKPEGKVPEITFNGEVLRDGYASLKQLLEPAVIASSGEQICIGCNG